jgi:hypothetical protein
MDPANKLHELHRLESEVTRLRAEIDASRVGHWPPAGYYSTYHVLSGAILGFFGAASSLLLNVIGSALVRQHPLELIRVYLTFPLGESALRMDSGLALAIGCALYLGTGMLYGVIFQIVLTRWFANASPRRELEAATVLGIALWLVNFYLVLSWLQPMLFDGSWIVSRIPWWVAALTHLVFAWTMFLIRDWGRFDPARYQEGES